MTKFMMTLQVDAHEHSPSASRRFVEHALEQVKLDVGRGVLTEGDIVSPAVGAQPARTIGRWELIED